MEIKEIEVAKLKGWSYKMFKQEVFNKIKASLIKHGQIDVVKVNQAYDIIDGFYLVKAMKELGWITCQCLVLTCNEAQFTEYQIVLNEQYFERDDIKFAELIERHVKSKFDAVRLSNILNMDSIDIIRFKDLLVVDWDKEEKELQNTLF
jgi:ParB-like chromosome segregation protein Spo0J